MGEVARGPQEARGQRDQLALRGDRAVVLEPGEHDLLDPLHIEELEGERAPAGPVEALEAVALSQAQELLGLA